MELNNNGITEPDSELRGLYILSAPLLDENQVVKFGMSECLQNRISAYTTCFKNSYYMACYVLADTHTKNEILAAETSILDITCQYKTDDFGSEYRRIGFNILNNIVCDYLNKNGIVYTLFIRPTWKYFNKNNSIPKLKLKHECPTCNIEFQKKSALDDHLNKKNKCKPLIEPTLEYSNKNNFVPKPKHECSICSRGFKKKCHLDDHHKKKNACKQLIEPLVQITLHPQQNLQKNLNDPIPTTNKNICHYCEKYFTRKDILTRHIKQHCPIAKQQIFDKSKLEKEQQEIIDKLKLLEDQNKTIIIKNEQLKNKIKNLKKAMEKAH